MYESIRSLFGGSKYADEDKISPSEVAQEVSTAHEKMDEMKLWAANTMEWLNEERDRIEMEGDKEMVDEISDLQMYVNTIILRIEYGDASIRPEEGGEEVQEE